MSETIAHSLGIQSTSTAVENTSGQSLVNQPTSSSYEVEESFPIEFYGTLNIIVHYLAGKECVPRDNWWIIHSEHAWTINDHNCHGTFHVFTDVESQRLRRRKW
jgi:hypothetical protein